MSNAVVIQQASGNQVPLLGITVHHHAAYCARHGINYWPVFGNVQVGRAPHWNKIVLVRHALEMGFDIVVWLDADTLVVRRDDDIRSALASDGGPLALAWHPGVENGFPPSHWNSGVMVMRNTPRVREFFKTVWELGPLGNHHWQEQARMLDLLPQYPDLVQRLDDRWNCTDGVTSAPQPVILAWHGAGWGAVPAMYDELKKIGAADARVAVTAEEADYVHSDNCVRRAAEFIERIPPCPGNFHGRGVVICGGGAGYFTSVWVCINQLRRVGCALPIQLWHLGPREMDQTMRAILAPLGVECVDAYALRRKHPARILNGWELKPYALLHSPFREVMLLDCDNVAVVDPAFLFDTPQFRETGAIFWPDYERMVPSRNAWKAFGVPFRDEPEFESGQIVLDKERHWRALNLTMWFNEYSDFFYREVWGDKDTFRFAWHRLGEKFSMPPFPIHSLEDTMCQHDFEGRRIFQHRKSAKWRLRVENKRIEGFLFEEECLADIERLRALWSGKVVRTE